MFLTLQQLKKARYSSPVSVGRVMWTYKGHVSAASGENWKECQQKLHLIVGVTQSEWDVSERSQSDFHWDRHLRDLLEKSQKRCPFCDVFKMSQKHLKKDVFCVTSLRRLEHIFSVRSLRCLKNISHNYVWFFKNTSQKWLRVISVGLLQYLTN